MHFEVQIDDFNKCEIGRHLQTDDRGTNKFLFITHVNIAMVACTMHMCSSIRIITHLYQGSLNNNEVNRFIFAINDNYFLNFIVLQVGYQVIILVLMKNIIVKSTIYIESKKN